jgi:hypothetical protein
VSGKIADAALPGRKLGVIIEVYAAAGCKIGIWPCVTPHARTPLKYTFSRVMLKIRLHLSRTERNHHFKRRIHHEFSRTTFA